MYAFCIARNVNHSRTSFDRFTQRDQASIDIRLVENRRNPLHVAKALEVIERLVPSKDGGDLPLLSQRASNMQEKRQATFWTLIVSNQLLPVSTSTPKQERLAMAQSKSWYTKSCTQMRISTISCLIWPIV